MKEGRRVELIPSTDAWMRGDRYGEVVKVTKTRVQVRMDRSGKTLSMPHAWVTEV